MTAQTSTEVFKTAPFIIHWNPFSLEHEQNPNGEIRQSKVCRHEIKMSSCRLYFYSHDIFINGVLRRNPRLNLKYVPYAVSRSEEVLTFKGGWTQLVKIKSPVAARHALLGPAHLDVPSMCCMTCALERRDAGGERWGMNVDRRGAGVAGVIGRNGTY